ncbi:MAG TPA: hypothetical protein VM307_10445 [Egibacteraceae bacterium]|nr:hypothetical protein [Egibacteraceae bacterium]
MTRTSIRLLFAAMLAVLAVGCAENGASEPTPGTVPELTPGAGPVPDETGTPAPIVS